MMASLPLATRPMSRDKADTLLLLCACALVLAPQTGNLPLWISSICGTLLLWRGWITFRGNRLPPRWLLLPIALLSMLGIYLTYKTLLGREAGVAMLVLLLALKLLEMHAKRDLFVVVFLSFFLMLTNFFNSQTIGTALMTVCAVIAMLTAQLSFQYTGAVPPLSQRLKLGSLIFALALPVTLVLFILFPRIQGPLWGLPNDANTGRTGLSDTMAPGNISKLAQSDDVAFRVKFIDPVPRQSKLYWRGIVLGDFDGRMWHHQPSSAQSSVPVTFKPHGAAIRHQITLEPNARRWLFALELPLRPPYLGEIGTEIAPDFQLLAAQPVNERIRYSATSYTDYELQPDASPAMLENWLELPVGYNPNTLAFADRLRRQSNDPRQLVDAVLRFFREEKFVYTLEPPVLGRHSIDEFLFFTRAGFCEHYSSAFVVLMRAMGIPARVVTGYQGGELNPVDGFMTVRQSDAHAWAEVWLQNRGWVRIDPTAAVAPERIEKNLRQAIPNTLMGGLVNLDMSQSPLLSVFRSNWDAVTNSWNQWVLNYTPDKQKSFIRSLGFGEVDWQTLTVLTFAIGAAVMAIVALPLVRGRQKTDPLRTVYLLFCQQMERAGLTRAAYEGPRAFQMRLTAADSPLLPAKKIAAARFLARYETLRYGTVSDAQPATGLSELKSLLNQCR